MFERYTEQARRAIFFARYEASQFGSSYIETEHLLLGLIREDRVLAARLLKANVSLESVRKQVQSRSPVRDQTSTSVDLPLSLDSKRVLADAAAEASALQHETIHSGHLILALLRAATCPEVSLLQQSGIDYAGYKDFIRNSDPTSPRHMLRFSPLEPPEAEPPSVWDEVQLRDPAAPSLYGAVVSLQALLDNALKYLNTHSDAYAEQHLKRKSWSRKEALGHLVDLASAHHGWLARALTEPNLTATEYPQDSWVSAQQYRDLPWQALVDLWGGLNRLILHLLVLMPEQKLTISCRIGLDPSIPLSALIRRYILTCEDLVGQILARL